MVSAGVPAGCRMMEVATGGSPHALYGRVVVFDLVPPVRTTVAAGMVGVRHKQRAEQRSGVDRHDQPAQRCRLGNHEPPARAPTGTATLDQNSDTEVDEVRQLACFGFSGSTRPLTVVARHS